MWSLKIKDFIKGLIVSVITAVLVVVQSSISNGELTFNWKAIGMSAVGAAVAYLLKNLLTDDVKVAEQTLKTEATKTDQSFYITPKQ